MLSQMDVKVCTASDTHKQQQLQEQQLKKVADEKASAKRQSEQAVAVLKESIESFGKPSENFSRLSSENTISLRT